MSKFIYQASSIPTVCIHVIKVMCLGTAFIQTIFVSCWNYWSLDVANASHVQLHLNSLDIFVMLNVSLRMPVLHTWAMCAGLWYSIHHPQTWTSDGRPLHVLWCQHPFEGLYYSDFVSLQTFHLLCCHHICCCCELWNCMEECTVPLSLLESTITHVHWRVSRLQFKARNNCSTIWSSFTITDVNVDIAWWSAAL